MKYSSIPLIVLFLMTACDNQSSEPIYQSESFSVYKDKVIQGEFQAVAKSPTHITSDYQSPANESFNPLVEFKFSINSKDNEMPVGDNHSVLISPENGKFEVPTVTFGVLENEYSGYNEGGKSLEPNTEVTFRLDFRPVLEAFEKDGYYTDFNGNAVAESDFIGVYVAGNAPPLTWDFVNLVNNPELELKDEDGDGIYETTVLMNAYNPENFTSQEWKLKNDISSYPQLKSDYLLVDALYNLSLDETVMNKEEDGTFRTGEAWSGVWTRDVSYSILLAYAIIDPEYSKTSLLRKIKRERIIQDTGSGGAWPVSSDRMTWAIAAWEIYAVTGDKEWLKEIYTYISNSIADDEKVVNSPTKMIRGESSFLDWREQSYPFWMDNVDIYNSENLGTNAVHFMTYNILFQMSRILGEENSHYARQANRIASSMNLRLWMEDKGYYGQYLYGRHYNNLSPRSETLGEALSVLFGIAHKEKGKQIVRNTPVVEYGAPCFYPYIDGKPPYHNNGIWPFVQAYWNWAAATAENEPALEHGLANIYRAAGLFLTNKENMVATNGDFRDTEINSNRQLWSVAGNLAMVYRVFFGMLFTSEKMTFTPAIPKSYAGTWTLENFKYRNSNLTIKLTGYGTLIKSMTLDGQPLDHPEIPGDLEGDHSVEIIMANRDFENETINLVPNEFDLSIPRVKTDGSTVEWEAVEGAAQYAVYLNGKKQETESTSMEFDLTGPAQIKIAAVDENGFESFQSEPVWLNTEDRTIILEAEQLNSGSTDPRFASTINYSGSGFVNVQNKVNKDIRFQGDVPPGLYLVDFRYSNGNGRWNTDNKCAIRTLFLNDKYAGAIVMPQRGVNEWSSWAYSNSILLEVGPNSSFSLKMEPENINMNVEVNEALVDHLRLIRLEAN